MHLPQMKKYHINYISELVRYNNEVTITYKETITDTENKDLAELALRG